MKTNLRHGHGHLSQTARAELTALLNQRLADVLDLQSQMKHAHWNVRGPAFFFLHELFDKLALELTAPADEIAERIAQLGGLACGTVRRTAARSCLPEFPADAISAPQVLAVMAEVLRRFVPALRADIATTETCRDPVTAGVLTDIATIAEKQRWLIDAHTAPQGMTPRPSRRRHFGPTGRQPNHKPTS